MIREHSGAEEKIVPSVNLLLLQVQYGITRKLSHLNPGKPTFMLIRVDPLNRLT